MNYLNTDRSQILFQNTLNNPIYVDKSLLIDKISGQIRTGSQYICITRPRRFGKTINANMLGAYYTKGIESRKLFDKLAVSDTEVYLRHINAHNVIYIDFSRMPDNCSCYMDFLMNFINGMKEDLRKAYPHLGTKEYTMLSQMLEDTKDSYIFIIDEWDSVFYKSFMSKEDKNAFISFLKNLLKDQPYVELAYMTGVLPIVKYSSGSELNMFDEYNLMNDNVYDSFFGFSEEEVRMLCEQYRTMPFEEIKRWYDGYYLSDGRSLFNPRSVSKALLRGVCLNYWTETGPMNEIADCIEHNVDEVREDIVKMVAGIPVEVELEGYSASELKLDTRDEILSAMTVYGFLSYHDGYLRIPNHELMEILRLSISS